MNQYDPNQQQNPNEYRADQQQPYQGYPPNYDSQPHPGYVYTPPPSLTDQVRSQLGNVNVGIIAAGALFVMMCGIGGCLVLIALLRSEPTPPRFPNPAPTSAVQLNTPQIIFTPIPAGPTANPAAVGQPVNPYVAARLDTMNQLFIDVLNPLTGQFERKAQILGTELDRYREAFNITNFVQAYDTACPDRVRLTAARADGSSVLIGVCLKNAVILRTTDIPELGGGELPMYPLFIDLIAPYLPPEYRQLLGIS